MPGVQAVQDINKMDISQSRTSAGHKVSRKTPPATATSPLLPKMTSEKTQQLSAMDDELEAEVHGVKPFGSLMALAICLNYIIGTGCFGLPYAFTQAGLLLTSSFLLVGGLFAILAMNYTLEFMARAEGLVSCHPGEMPDHRIGYRKFDFSKISEIFQGVSGRSATQLVITCYAIGTLWSYASVFSSSTSSLYFSYFGDEKCDVQFSPSSGCLTAYYVSMLIYAVIVISLALMDVGEQAIIQTFLAAYRVVAFSVMLVTLCIKLSIDGSQTSVRAENIGLVNLSNFAAGFGPCLLAINCHYNMPDAIQPLKNKKGTARRVTFMALGISCFVYLIFGLFASLAFDPVNPLASLNWSDYTGCGDGWDKSCKKTFLGPVIQLLVLFFPVVNVSSSYPLVCVTVGDNLMMLAPERLVERFSTQTVKTAFRLVATVPPLLLATFFKKLDTIFTLAGLFGFVLGLIIPALLQASSVKYCEKRWSTSEAAITPYTAALFSSVKSAYIFTALGLVALLVAIVTLRV